MVRSSPSATAPSLRAADAPALAWLARNPFLSAADLAILLAVEDASGVHRRLRRLAAWGLVEHVVPSSDHLQPQWLAYLTDAGLRRAAALEGQEPADFAWHWQCGEPGLLRRLVRLDHLVFTRGFLLDLQAALRAQHQTGLALASWHVWPVRWPFVWHDRWHALPLDGAGAISRSQGAEGPAYSSFILLWDGDAHVAVDAAAHPVPSAAACAACRPLAVAPGRARLPHRAAGVHTHGA